MLNKIVRYTFIIHYIIYVLLDDGDILLKMYLHAYIQTKLKVYYD